MNKTLSITRNTNAQQVFTFLEGVSQARNRLHKSSASAVPDPSIRVRKRAGLPEIYVSPGKEGKKQTVASALSPTKRAKRMKCAELMFGVAKKFSVEHQLQNDQKVRTALAELKHATSGVLNHDIKAGEMHALFETILIRPAEITTGGARSSTPLMAQTEPEKNPTPRPAAENRETVQAPPAKKKTRRPRLKNITRPLEAAARKGSRTPGNERVAAEIIRPAPVLVPRRDKRMALTSTTSESAVFANERRPLIDQSMMMSRIGNKRPAPMPMPQDRSRHAAPAPARPRKGLLAFFSRILQGLRNFFRSRFG
jgi:hypothetical protein